MTTFKRKLIEVALPLDAINRESAREKSIRHGHPSTLHLWWSRKPLSAARAVLWSSLVDDPSSHPDRFPTEELQEAERQRLFGILEELVKWENSNNEQVLEAARAEIVASCDGDLPRVLDPFCGGGTIPLEAQRLGLEALGGDLNPVAVLISKAMVEIPPRFAGMPPVNPVSRAESGLKTWERAQGLAEDVRYYGQWMRDRAFERIGHLYPKVQLPADQGGGEATVIAWIWARTVESPDPSWNGHVPLVRSWVLRKESKSKPVVWIEPVVDRDTQTITYQIREGGTPPDGTVHRGKGVCVATGSPIAASHIRGEAAKRRLGESLLAAVVAHANGRSYLSSRHVPGSSPAVPNWVPPGKMPQNPRWFTPPQYAITDWADLFRPRQLVALDAFSTLLAEVRAQVEEDHQESRGSTDSRRLREGGNGAAAYSDAILTYLAFAIDKAADYWSSICSWHNSRQLITHGFTRQAVPLAWDHAEANPFAGASGDWLGLVEWVARVVDRLPAGQPGDVVQRDAKVRVGEIGTAMICSDPPYYDNIGYAAISDYFYAFLRRNLRDVWPDETTTLETPKDLELIADRFSRGSPEKATEHFESGMSEFFAGVAGAQDPACPSTFFYAYKQAEEPGATEGTGWESFLQGLIRADLMVSATWPIRTELANRLVGAGRSALSSSIVIACRPRDRAALAAATSEFRSALGTELPAAVRVLQAQAIAPVDLAQSAIGPGMRVFSRYPSVVEADGSAMSVGAALQIINEVLEGVLSEEETEFDSDTRWALTWYRQHGLDEGPFGSADVLARAKDTSVAGVIEAGFVASRDGKVWLMDRDDLSSEWDPGTDRRSTVWEATQHLVHRLEDSELEAARLLRRLGGTADRARQLAYLLYRVAEQKGWAQEAVAYNSLVVAWPELERLARAESAPEQQTLGGAS